MSNPTPAQVLRGYGFPMTASEVAAETRDTLYRTAGALAALVALGTVEEGSNEEGETTYQFKGLDSEARASENRDLAAMILAIET